MKEVKENGNKRERKGRMREIRKKIKGRKRDVFYCAFENEALVTVPWLNIIIRFGAGIPVSNF